MGTRIKFIMFFGMFLLIVGGVFALSLTDKIKVEKVGDTYTIYEVKEKITTKEIDNKINELENYEFDIEYCFNIEGLCDMDCRSSIEYIGYEECYKQCGESWGKYCKVLEDIILEENQRKIKELNDLRDLK